MTEATPYGDLTVVELADDPAGEATGKLLATMGADVIKVELPEGAPGAASARSRPAPATATRTPACTSGSTTSTSAAWCSTTGPPTAWSGCVACCSRPTSCITGWRPAEWADLGITPAELRDGAPGLIVINLSPFGLDGPWADMVSSDLVGLALGGPLNSCGYDDHSIPPIRPGGDQGYQLAASFAHLGILLALIERQRTGRGELVDVAMHDCLAVSAELANPYWFYPRVLVHRQTCRHAQPTPTQPALFATRRRPLRLLRADHRRAKAVAEPRRMDGHRWDWPSTSPTPEYDDPEYRQANFAHIQELVEVFFLLQTGRRHLPRGPAARPAGRRAQRAGGPAARRAPDGQELLRSRRR